MPHRLFMRRFVSLFILCLVVGLTSCGNTAGGGGNGTGGLPPFNMFWSPDTSQFQSHDAGVLRFSRFSRSGPAEQPTPKRLRFYAAVVDSFSTTGRCGPSPRRHGFAATLRPCGAS